jgi:cell cycle checkpoint protein
MFNSYAYSTFILCQKALLASIKVSLRIDDDGFLSLQLMMPKPAFKELEGKDFGIIEFKMKALQEDDE